MMAVGTEFSSHPTPVVPPLDDAEAYDGDAPDASFASTEFVRRRDSTLQRPPHPPMRRCITSSQLSHSDMARADMDAVTVSRPKHEFLPLIRSGGWADIGCRKQMEDTHIMVNDLTAIGGGSGAYYGVFDGHSGKHAAIFVKENLLRHIIEDEAYPSSVQKAVRQAFIRTDEAFAEACQNDETLCSGTTALAVLILGRKLLVANAGDCRAVLCKRGKAIEMSRDHKASCVLERKRIEMSGGFVDSFGYLNGELTVARALGDWHINGLKESGSEGPLTAVPEMNEISLSEEDEFLIIGCDGLWDVFTSENAVEFARRRLQLHNDPHLCSKELVKEALRRETSDNLTVLIVSFQDVPPPRRLPILSPVKRSISAEGLQSLSAALQEVTDG